MAPLAMPAVELRRNGLNLSGTALWLDATRKSELSFVSHAHSDHIARHERVIATAPTVKLMTHRLGKIPSPLPAPYNRPFELGPLVLELFPAGHMLGSAQLRATRADGVRITYSGDINFSPMLTAEPAQLAECDTLILESTFGHPRYRFPPRDEVLASVEAWIRRCLDGGVAPVLLCYPMGKSQEAMKYLSDRGYPLCAHASVYEASRIYAECGVSIRVRRFGGDYRPGEVLVFPPRIGRGSALAKVWPRQTAVLTGWALDGPQIARRYGADLAFPVSDHADFEGLVRYAKATGASEVITHHGFAQELADALCAEGLDARPVGSVKQLELF